MWLKTKIYLFNSYLDETNTETLNGHATSSVTSEEVKVHIESAETQLEEHAQATGPLRSEDKTGNLWTRCRLRL